MVILRRGRLSPARVVENAELVRNFPEITEQYMYQVTGIRQRRWAGDDERPSGMAFKASLEAIRKSGIATKDIDAIMVATTTPDVAMPSTACILQDRLCLPTVPAFDINAACSGWLYAVSMARGMILSGMARNVLTVGVEMQSRLLDASDRNAYFLFGDGAGAAVISAGTSGHRIRQTLLGLDTRGLQMARRESPGYAVANGHSNVDPWIRIDGHALFRFATDSFADLIRRRLCRPAGRWTTPLGGAASGQRPHSQGRGQAERHRLPALRDERGNVGNTSSASIPLALVEVEDRFQPGDKLLLASVRRGIDDRGHLAGSGRLPRRTSRSGELSLMRSGRRQCLRAVLHALHRACMSMMRPSFAGFRGLKAKVTRLKS